MKSVKLTQDAKFGILNNASNNSEHSKILDEIENRILEVGNKIRIEYLASKGVKDFDLEAIDKSVSELIKNIPDEFIHSTGIICSGGRFNVKYNFHGKTKHYTFYFNTMKYIPERTIEIPSHSQFIAQLISLLEEFEIAKKKSDEFLIEIENILKSFNTTKQLLDAWPEAIELFPDSLLNDTRKKTKNLPALKTDKLNKVLNLPTDKKA